MVWVQRVTGAVFVIGVVALIAAVVTMASRADDIPPLPVYAGILGLVALILLAGACLALMSMAISARRGAEALQRLARQGGQAPGITPTRPFSTQPLREEVQPDPGDLADPRPPRPAGRRLVAER